MVQKRFFIALDIKRPTANRDFEVVEGDNGNVLEVTLTDDGTAVDLTGCKVCAIFSKSDGNTAQQDTDAHGISVTLPNKLTISLYTTSVAPGLVECDLQVYSGPDHTVLSTSAKFNFMCRRGIANDDTIEATDEWPILIGVLQRVEAAEEAEEHRVTAEQGRVLAEGQRATSEIARKNAEDTRGIAEGARLLAEQGRATAESSRSAAEQARVTAETVRSSNESARILAESARAGAETTRQAQEGGRVAVEAARVTAEQERAGRDADYRKLEPYDSMASYVPLNKVTYEGSCYQCIQPATGIVPTNTDYWALIAKAGEGSGDMLKATYDADNDGVVDDAAKLGGQAASYYATAADLTAHAGNTNNPHGVTRAQIGAATVRDFIVNVNPGNWSAGPPWTMTITVAGMTAAMRPFADVVPWYDGYSVQSVIDTITAFSRIDRIVTNNGSVTLYCYQEAPVTGIWIDIRLRVVQ